MICLDCKHPTVSWRCYGCTGTLATALGDHRAAFTQTITDARERYPDFDFDGEKKRARIEAEWQTWKAKKAKKKVRAS